MQFVFRNAKLMIADDYDIFFPPYTELNGFIISMQFQIPYDKDYRVFKRGIKN